MNCPHCDTYLINDRECSCGWKSAKSTARPIDPNHGLCAWTDRGMRCSRVGTLCPSTTNDDARPQWYCAWHYECVTRGLSGRRQGHDYDEWCKGEMRYVLDHDRPVMRNTWDASDTTLIKGLVFLGANSIAWKHAPKECQDAARALMQTWTPPTHDMPQVAAERGE